MEMSLKETFENWCSTVQAAALSPDPSSLSSSMPRRTNKPLTEKRRRARINRSLTDLKSILLADRRPETVMSGRSQKQSKLEKADILEMTVRHFHMLRVFENGDLDKYRAGYTACIREAERYLNFPNMNSPFDDPIERENNLRLLRHLKTCLLEFELKKIIVPADKAKASAKGKSIVNCHSKSSKIKSALKIEKPPQPNYDEPLDYSIPKAKKSMYAVKKPVNDFTMVINNEIDVTPSCSNNPMSDFLDFKPASVNDNMDLFPPITNAMALPELNIPNVSHNFLAVDNDDAMDDTEWKFKELRKVLLSNNETPMNSTSRKTVKLESIKLEDFSDMSPHHYGNIDDMDEAIDIKANMDDPMWRPW